MEAAILNTSASLSFPRVSMSVTAGAPSVMVPVLSKITISILWDASKASPFLNKTPASAPLPVPTIMAVGVASPRAQGHAITRTDISTVRENSKDSPLISQTENEIMETANTTGTKYSATLSASLAIGAFDP